MEGLDIARSGTTLVATVERGEQNSFSGEMIDAFSDAIDEAGDDGSTVFVRLRTRGGVFILARDREGTTPDELRAEGARIVRINETLRRSPLISIAEVNGDAAGFGVGIVAASDIAVASSEATFRFPEITYGLAPTVVISWATKVLPQKRAFDMAVTGEPIDAGTAERIGLITEAAPPDRVEARVDERIAAMERWSASALREIKRFFVHVRGMDPALAAASSVDPLVLASLRMRAS